MRNIRGLIFVILSTISIGAICATFAIPELVLSFDPKKNGEIERLQIQTARIADTAVFMAHHVLFMITRSNVLDDTALPVTHAHRQEVLRTAMEASGITVDTTDVRKLSGHDAFVVEGRKSSMYHYSATLTIKGRTIRILLVSPNGPPGSNHKAMQLLDTFAVGA